LKLEVEKRYTALPDYIQKLVMGYEMRTYYFEMIECLRKLAIVCLPVWFQPAGSVSQLVFGLVVCFLTFGVHMVYHPYIERADDRLAQLCQVQIFFSLLSSIVLKYDENTIRDATNIDVLLGALTLLPICIGFILESPLADYIGSEEELLQQVLHFWWRVRRDVKNAGIVSSTGIDIADIAITSNNSEMADGTREGGGEGGGEDRGEGGGEGGGSRGSEGGEGDNYAVTSAPTSEIHDIPRP
jgi:uncharacterized membrane protein YgcG